MTRKRCAGIGWVLAFAAVAILWMGGAASAARTLDIVFVIDTSGSINANERALEIGGIKTAIEDVLLPASSLMEICVGAVCFSNQGAELLPLTRLSAASLANIHAGIERANDPSFCSHTGRTNLGDGLKVAIGLLATGSGDRRVINLVSNGNKNMGLDPVPIADQFKAVDGHEIWTLGVAVSETGKALLERIAGPAPAGYFPATDFDDFKDVETQKLGKIVDGDIVDSFAELLEGQLGLLESFSTLLVETWSELTPEERIALASSFEDLLKRMAELLTSFEDVLKGTWPRLDPTQRGRYLRRFEEMLRRQSGLLSTFEYLVKTLEGIALPPVLDAQGFAVPTPCTVEMQEKGLCSEEESDEEP